MSKERYVVLKQSDLEAAWNAGVITANESIALDALRSKVEAFRATRGEAPLHVVVIEFGSPEFEPAMKFMQALANPPAAVVYPDSCPHAAPFVYCQKCAVDPCPLGLKK